ncbi:MAG: hypothetical protein K2H96_11700, partial [Muribaculaceae bacterium]|nr:hypothetical protein [Muribaculaceae bacterium]
MSFAACSDDIFDSPREEIPENGEIPVAFNIPDMTTEQTRAGVDENAIGKVTMLMYAAKDGSLIDAGSKELTLTNNRTVITIPEAHRQNKNLYFLFFVNDSRNAATFTGNSDKQMSVATLAENNYLTIAGATENDARKMTMSGAISLNDLLELTPVNLYRNAAKVTVAPYEDNSSMKFEYEVYGTAKSSKLMAGSYNYGSNNSASNYCGSPVKVETFTDFGNDHNHNVGTTTYLHPTLNKEGRNLNASYIMVRAKNEAANKYYFYRLNFQNEEFGVMDILPNHHYEVKIKTDKIGIGYTTQEEAAENPIPLESGMYVIYDHSPKVFNIITDGVRALGVSDKLTIGEDGKPYLYVKLFSSKDEANDEYADFKAKYKDYIKFADNSWVSLTDNITEVSGADLGSAGSNSVKDENNHTYSDGDTDGVIYKIEASFTASSAGSQSTIGTVTWKGLNRKFDVVWDRSFKAEDLYDSVSASFTGNTYGSNPSVTAGKYFEWIGGQLNDDGTYAANPKVWGADKKSNNGDPRDHGLQFPMQGGGTATYTVTLKDLGDGEPYSWSYSYEGDNVGCTLTALNGSSISAGSKQSMTAGAKPSFKISGGNDNFNYGVANLVIRVEKTARDVEEYRIPLYHTGFFANADMNPNSENSYQKSPGIGLAKDLETGRDYTYYEVVTIRRDGRTYHMLDRNLGAHSAEMYVEATGDVEYAGNKEAAGGYYRVAGYRKESKPDIRVDLICNISGFTIPQKEVFDDIRNSSNFSMAQVGSYYTAVYVGDEYGVADDNGNRKRKYTYFPKARYMNKDNSKVGDSRAGYYWTATASTGLEKEDIGAWLDCFTMTGSTSTYMRGEVFCDDYSNRIYSDKDYHTKDNSVRTGQVNGFAMPVRLILGTDNSAGSTVHRTHFFVTGATHVYLYTLDSKGKPNPVTTWPGYAITTASNVSKKYNFLYESKVNETKDLYAIFNFKTASGAIFSMSYNAEDIKKGRFTNTTSPKDLIGFNLAGVSQSGMQNGLAPDYANYGNATKSIANEKSWTFSFDTSTAYATASEGGIGEYVPVSKDYIIYYPKNGSSEFYLWYKEGSSNKHIKFNGNDNGHNSNNTYGSDYYYAEFTHTGNESDLLYMSRGSGHANKELNKALKDFEKGDDGKYYAWIDTDDVFHDGKPSGGTQTETYYYRINVTGNQNDAFAYGTHTMTESSGKWVLSGLTKPKGNFEIQKCKNSDNSVVATIRSNNSSNHTVVKDVAHPTKESTDSGERFWINEENTNGTCTLTFNPSANTLTLTVEGGSGNNERTYRIYWKWSNGYQTDRDWIYVYTEGDYYNVLPETLSNKSHHEKSGVSDGKAYLEFKSTNTNLKFKFIVMRSKESWGDLQSGDWQVDNWTENNGIWENRTYEDTW